MGAWLEGRADQVVKRPRQGPGCLRSSFEGGRSVGWAGRLVFSAEALLEGPFPEKEAQAEPGDEGGGHDEMGLVLRSENDYESIFSKREIRRERAR